MARRWREQMPWENTGKAAAPRLGLHQAQTVTGSRNSACRKVNPGLFLIGTLN